MRVLTATTSGTSPDHVVLIFGLGMIGSSISNSLTRLDFRVAEDIGIDWSTPETRAIAFADLKHHVVDLHPRPIKVSVVWSAGNAAFHSSPDEVAQEKMVFEEALAIVKEILEKTLPVHFRFHFISSAGGLFEGQQVVDLQSRPQPLRPYGELKMSQEAKLKTTFKPSELALYRPSSVYGPMTQDSRRGLINNLISNSRNERPTVLDAHTGSLRDYVFSHDIGHYVARSIRTGNREQSSSEHFLVSARCSSIFEVVKKIERVLNRKIRVRYDENFGNHRNITFSHRVLPQGWRPVTLDVGIKQFMFNR